MRIAVIGAGNIGGTLVKKFCALGHAVSVANSKGPESLADFASATGAKPATTTDAIKNAEVIIVSVPEKSVEALSKVFAGVISPKTTIVDTGNYYPMRDGAIAALDHGQVESEWVSKQLGHAVIKAFNNIMAQSLAECGISAGTKNRIALPIAGDDKEQKATVMELVYSLGFDPLDSGSLLESWRQQPGAPVYCTDLDVNGVRIALTKANRRKMPILRDELLLKIMAQPQDMPHKERVAWLRSFYE